MKKMNLFKTLGGVAIIGTASATIPIVTTSCSKGIEITFNTKEEVTDYFNKNCKIYQDPLDLSDPLVTNQRQLDYFLKEKRIWGINLLYLPINVFLLKLTTNFSPIKININYDIDGGSFKLLKDLIVYHENGEKVTYRKGTEFSYFYRDNILRYSNILIWSITSNSKQEEDTIFNQTINVVNPNKISIQKSGDDFNLDISAGGEGARIQIPHKLYPNIKFS